MDGGNLPVQSRRSKSRSFKDSALNELETLLAPKVESARADRFVEQEGLYRGILRHNYTLRERLVFINQLFADD